MSDVEPYDLERVLTERLTAMGDSEGLALSPWTVRRSVDAVLTALLAETYDEEGGVIVLRQLRTVRRQRDQARDWAVRLEQELQELAEATGLLEML